MTSIASLPVAHIRTQIRDLRGLRVLLDADLATFYCVPTSRPNEAVRRNLGRFPRDFRFQLNHQELAHLKSQFAISSQQHGGNRQLPWAFTEHGCLMVANILNSRRAIQVSVFIVRAFLELRSVAFDHHAIAAKLAELESRLSVHDDKIGEIIDALHALAAPSGPDHERKIGFHRGNR